MRDIAATHPIFETPVMSVAVVFIPDLHGSSVSKGRMRPVEYLLSGILKAIKLLSLKQFISQSSFHYLTS